MAKRKTKKTTRRNSKKNEQGLLGNALYHTAKFGGKALYSSAKLGGKIAWNGAKQGVKFGVNSVPVMIEAGAEGIKNANPFRDVSRLYSSGKNIIKNGFSKKEYVQDLKQGKFLGKGNGATLGLYGGLFASGAYLPLKATQGVLGAGTAVARNILGSNPVKKGADFLKKGLGEKLENFTEKENYRKKVAPRIYEGAFGAIGYFPIIAGMWGAQGIEKIGNSLKKAKSNLVKKLGNGLSKTGNMGNNALGQSLTIASLANAYHNVTNNSIVPNNPMLSTRLNLEEIVNNGVRHAENGASAIVFENADFGSEEKYAVLIRGYGDEDMCAHIESQTHSYDSLIKAGFKPENIYVLGPDAGRNDGSALSREYASANYDTSISKENLAKIFDKIASKADGNDVFLCKVIAHGLYDGENSFIGINNGKEEIYDYELAEMQKNIHAGGEFNIITACQSGNHSKVLPNNTNPGWGNYRPNVNVVSESLPTQNAQAYYRFGDHVMDVIAENGIDYKTNFKDVVSEAESRYSSHDKSWNKNEQHPVVHSNGTNYYIDTCDNGNQRRLPIDANGNKHFNLVPVYFLDSKRKAA